MYVLIINAGSCLSCLSVMEKEITTSLMMTEMSRVCKSVLGHVTHVIGLNSLYWRVSFDSLRR